MLKYFEVSIKNKVLFTALMVKNGKKDAWGNPEWELHPKAEPKAVQEYLKHTMSDIEIRVFNCPENDNPVIFSLGY